MIGNSFLFWHAWYGAVTYSSVKGNTCRKMGKNGIFISPCSSNNNNKRQMNVGTKQFRKFEKQLHVEGEEKKKIFSRFFRKYFPPYFPCSIHFPFFPFYSVGPSSFWASSGATKRPKKERKDLAGWSFVHIGQARGLYIWIQNFHIMLAAALKTSCVYVNVDVFLYSCDSGSINDPDDRGALAGWAAFSDSSSKKILLYRERWVLYSRVKRNFFSLLSISKMSVQFELSIPCRMTVKRKAMMMLCIWK